MKTIVAIAFTSLLSALTFGQSSERTVREIENRKKEIKNNLFTFQKTVESEEEGYRTIYKTKEGVAFIELNVIDKLTLPESPIEKHVEWYFSKGHLIYSEQIWTDTRTKHVIDNQKFYLDQLNLIKWLKFDKVVSVTENNEYAELGKKLYEYGEVLSSKAD